MINIIKYSVYWVDDQAEKNIFSALFTNLGEGGMIHSLCSPPLKMIHTIDGQDWPSYIKEEMPYEIEYISFTLK